MADFTDELTVDDRTPRKHFLRQIVEDDLASGKHREVVTRFPPEPNGYLHIGHAKSICLNFGLARDYGGRCHMRFDDTNPTTEDMEFVESIQRDVKWLGFDWGENLFFASDYFEQLYQFVVKLVQDGKAYVCDLSEEDIRAYRGSLKEPGRPSPFRDRSVEENLALLQKMRDGHFPDGACVLRAKIDMSAANMKMRDPLLYRIRHAHHYRTGDAWCIYPMYDFAHCLSDALERISHSICTLEFENNRELYDWLVDAVGIEEPRPKQFEFARLNLTYTIMSKRKLLELVESGRVSGWDDPRMPTVAGMRRRGYTPEAVRAFAELVGIAKTNSTVDIDKLEFCVRDDLNARAPRALGVLRPLKVVLTNYPEGETEWLDVPSWPSDVPKQGSRMVPFSRTLYLERDDFAQDPPPGFHRLTPGGEVRLRYAYVIRCEEVISDSATGEVVELRCTYDKETGGGHSPTGRKPKGIVHWVSAEHAVPAEVRLYDRLFSVERPDADPEGRPYVELLNPRSLEVVEQAWLEPSLGSLAPGAHVQLERLGFFFVDPALFREGKPVLNRVVGLKDSWAKLQRAATEQEPSPVQAAPIATARESRRPPRLSQAERAERTRDGDAVLQDRFEVYQATLGLSSDDASLLTRDRELSDFFEAARTLATPRTVASWLLNEVLREAKDRPLAALALTPRALGELVALVETGEVTAALGREVLSVLASTGGSPREIVEARGLKPLTDRAAIAAAVQEVLAAHPDEAARLGRGESKLLGFFTGHVMRKTGGKALAQVITEELRQHMASGSAETKS
jgi:glutaminyl-tRNA synthetase